MTIPQSFSSKDIESVFAQFKRDIVEGDLSEAFRETAPIICEGFGSNIDSAREEDGTPWPPHAPATVRIHGPHPLLVLNYHLLSALTEESSSGNISETQPRSAEFGVDGDVIPYATTHQYGWGHIPRREYLYANDEVLENATATFSDWSFEIIVGS